jgi:hypothetical protein
VTDALQYIYVNAGSISGREDGCTEAILTAAERPPDIFFEPGYGVEMLTGHLPSKTFRSWFKLTLIRKGHTAMLSMVLPLEVKGSFRVIRMGRLIIANFWLSHR